MCAVVHSFLEVVMEILSSIEFWKFTVPLFGAVIAWFTNESRKRLADEYQLGRLG